LNRFIASSLTRAVGLPSREAPGQASAGVPSESARASVAEPTPSGASKARLVRRAIIANLIVAFMAGIAAVILLIVAWQQSW
ncbi:MAG TPA: hypothetical protein VFA49_06155, partial [Chloroflexota bacterium]|nr:hypothetical protein [Chloroflexota bacterium]